MSGGIDHMSLSETKQDAVSAQSRLSSFGTGDGSDTTYIAIVHNISDEMEHVCDEHEPRLSPPDELFYQWLNTKQNIKDDGLNDTVAHNGAIDFVDYEERFDTYLREDPDAQDAIDELNDRVESGEDIVLVCFCDGEKICHRTMVVQTIRSIRQHTP